MTSSDHHGDPARLFKLYMVIAGALAIFTITSFVVNGLVQNGTLTAMTGFLIILGVAVVKAILVGAYFMHLVFDWNKLYFMIVPAFILGTMMMFVLLPDIVFNYWR